MARLVIKTLLKDSRVKTKTRQCIGSQDQDHAPRSTDDGHKFTFNTFRTNSEEQIK